MSRFVLAYVMIFFFAVCSHAQSLFTAQPGQKPLEAALAFLQDELPDGYAEGNQITTIKQEPVFCTGSQPCHVQNIITLTIDGLADDSAKAQRHILVLEQVPDQPWQIIKHDTEWACWPGRGHIEFSTELCI